MFHIHGVNPSAWMQGPGFRSWIPEATAFISGCLSHRIEGNKTICHFLFSVCLIFIFSLFCLIPNRQQPTPRDTPYFPIHLQSSVYSCSIHYPFHRNRFKSRLLHIMDQDGESVPVWLDARCQIVEPPLTVRIRRHNIGRGWSRMPDV